MSEKWKKPAPDKRPGFKSRKAHEAYLNYFTFSLLDRPVPDFKKETDRGKPISKNYFKGKTTLINFWYYGCLGCMLKIPALNKIKAAYRKNDQVQFLAFFKDSITLDSNNQRLYESQVIGEGIPQMAPMSAFPAHETCDEFKFQQIPNAIDIIELFQVKFYPVTMIVDEDGVIRYIKAGIRKTENFPDSLVKSLKLKIDRLANQ